MDKEYHQLKVDKTITCMPSTSDIALQLMLAHSAEAAKDPKTEKINALLREANKPRSKKKHCPGSLYPHWAPWSAPRWCHTLLLLFPTIVVYTLQIIT
jgi:hypothetical protein